MAALIWRPNSTEYRESLDAAMSRHEGPTNCNAIGSSRIRRGQILQWVSAARHCSHYGGATGGHFHRGIIPIGLGATIDHPPRVTSGPTSRVASALFVTVLHVWLPVHANVSRTVMMGGRLDVSLAVLRDSSSGEQQ